MKEAVYISKNTVLINFTNEYHNTFEELLTSKSFKGIVKWYLSDLKERNEKKYAWICDKSIDKSAEELIKLIKLLTILEVNEVEHRLLKDKEMFLEMVEDFYTFYRNKQRCTVINASKDEGLLSSSFIEADTRYNALVLSLYRSIQEKIQGRKNKVYRQLQAGSNASMVLRKYKWNTSKTYVDLEKIQFVDSIMLRTPLLLHPSSNKRTGMFVQTEHNPIFEFTGNPNAWFCYPCKVGSLLTYIYVHRDFTFSALALSNLFEMATDSECIGHKPDLILLFGNEDHKDECVYFQDVENDIWVGKVSYAPIIEYFGYLKKMTLTLHNLAMISKGWLPLHGSMVNMTLNTGEKKGIVFIGDSGAGKSETIEALQKLKSDKIVSMDIIFDDMGSIHLKDKSTFAQGTEIGAFIRLDDLDRASAYRDMDRSIFFNPETDNARVVIPVIQYKEIIKNHPVHMFMYANNYTEKTGIHRFSNMEEAKDTFKTGKRFALGTTQEKGISTTYFANPFGPMQRAQECDPIIDEVFDVLHQNKVYIGEVYTGLGLKDKGNNGLEKAAEMLLDTIIKL